MSTTARHDIDDEADGGEMMGAERWGAACGGAACGGAACGGPDGGGAERWAPTAEGAPTLRTPVRGVGRERA